MRLENSNGAVTMANRRVGIDLSAADLKQDPLLLSRIYLTWCCGVDYRDLERIFGLVRRNGVTARRACSLVDAMFHAPRQNDRHGPIAKAIARRLPCVNLSKHMIEDDPLIATYFQIEIQWRKIDRLQRALYEWTSAVMVANAQLKRILR